MTSCLCQSLARAYALTVQCAAACAPSKNSPATYATCYKQHAATAAAPKAPVRPAGFRTATVKSKLPKPISTGALQQGQIKRVDLNFDTLRGPALQNLRNMVEPVCPDGQTAGIDNVCPPPKTKTVPPTTKSSGGDCGGSIDDGKTFKEIRCQTGCNKQCGKGGCSSSKSPRLQFGVYNDSPEVDFNVTVKIPGTWTGQDSVTLQVGGVAHHGSCNTDGYKAYVGINGGGNGIGTETGDKHYTDLHANCDTGVGNLQPGQMYRLRALKKNVGSSVQVNTWVNDKPHCSVTHAQGILGRKYISPSCPAVDQLRVDGWPDCDLSNAISVNSGPPNG